VLRYGEWIAPGSAPLEWRHASGALQVRSGPMAQRAPVTAVLVLSLAAGSCGGRSTQIVLHLDSNAHPGRTAVLALVSRTGSPTLLELEAFQGSRVRLSNHDRPLFPGSVALVPASNGPRSTPITVLATLELPATERFPAVRIERLQRLQLIANTPQQARIFFNVACAAPTEGCRSVPVTRCTQSVLCLERGETCGDEGLCVPLELPMEPLPQLDAGARFDVTTRADTQRTDVESDVDGAVMDASFDAIDDRPELDAEDTATAPLDAGVDARADVVPESSADSRATIDSGIDVRADSGVDVRADSGVDVRTDSGVGPTAVRLIAPMSTSRVAQPRPTLEFELPVTATDAVIELCSNRAMSVGCTSFMASTGSARVPVARPAGWTFWQVTPRRAGTPLAASGVWQFFVGSRGPTTALTTIVGKVMDLNGDGRADLVVSSRGAEEVAVFHGTPMGFGTTPTRVLAAPTGVTLFGTSVDAAGDIDGDGFGDLVVGASGTAAGHALVYLGGPTGVDATPRFTLTGVDGMDEFGASVAGAGDVDGDGYGDLLIGAPRAAVAGVGNAGTATMFMGGPRPMPPARSTVLRGANLGDRFGISVAGCGDVNADGLTDVMVGAPGAAPGGLANAGEARAYFGRATGIRVASDATLLGLAAEDNFGRAIAVIGDYNADGAADIVVGAPSGSTRGSSRIAFGATSGTVFLTRGEFYGAAVTGNDAFGSAVAAAGDVNNDGYADLVVGAPNANYSATRAGAFFVCLGIATGVRSPCTSVINTTANDQLGASAAGLGDFNADGFDDIVVGAPAATRAGRASTGLVRLYRGSASGLNATAVREIIGSVVNQRLGHALGSSAH